MRKDAIEQFLTFDEYQKQTKKYKELYGPHGSLLFVSCDAGKELARDVRNEYYSLLEQKGIKKEDRIEIPLMEDITKKFEENGHDGTCPFLPHHVGGADAFVFQNIMDKRENSKSVNENLMELLQMSYTLKKYGARRVVAIVPYFPYARQDKPSYMQREVSLARFSADLADAAGIDYFVSYHPHTTSIVGFFPVNRQFSYISGIDLFREIFIKLKNRAGEEIKKESIIAFPTDAGSLKETIYFADAINVDFGVAAKHRPVHDKSFCLGVLADMKGKKIAIITDDETATFSSIFDCAEGISQKEKARNKAALEKTIKEFEIEEIYCAISHMRAGINAIPKIEKACKEFNIKEIHITNSVPQRSEILSLPYIITHPLDRMWAYVVNTLHYDRSLRRLFYNPYEGKK